MTRRIVPSGQGRDGFIVVAVLWMLGALATLASIYAVYVINTATAMGVNDDRLQAEGLMRAALELTTYRLSATDAENRPSRGDFAFRLGRAVVRVDFRSEAGRIDLNSAPKELLAGLFAGLGARPADAEYYADRVIGWRTPQDPDRQNEEAAAYRGAGLSYAPRQGLFEHVGELALVLGLPPFLVERALPFVTVYSARAEINIVAAPPEVVAAVPGMTPDRVYALLSQIGRTPQNAEFLKAFVGDQPGITVEAGKTVRVAMRMDFDTGRRVQGEAVILLGSEIGEPFRVLSWRDDFDGPT
ncbi:MAG: general secretion pathway protein GspK [Alphaproteobacteria bacterium]|nr:general secretion pathway protein GspK [Alphaproteobacteria bacterium]